MIKTRIGAVLPKAERNVYRGRGSIGDWRINGMMWAGNCLYFGGEIAVYRKIVSVSVQMVLCYGGKVACRTAARYGL